MSNILNPRKSSIDIRYNGANVTAKLMPKLQNFTYTDCADGESDSISMEFEDIDRKWLNEWQPVKGDIIKAFVYTSNWLAQGEQRTFNCGEFIVDEYSENYPPMVCTINAVSAPVNKSFSATQRTVVWENVSIEGIISTIAKKSGMNYVYDADYWKISSLEQSSETDSEFLYNLCKKYGISMKVYSNKIVAFDREKYKAKAPILTFKEYDLISYSFTDALLGSYTGGKISYTNTSDKEIEYTYGDTTRLLQANEKADNKADAEKILKAALNEANHNINSLSVKIMPDLRITAGVNIVIEGIGRLSGKYYVDKVTHGRSGSAGYSMELSLSKVG